MLKFRSFDFHKDICIFQNSQTKLLGLGMRLPWPWHNILPTYPSPVPIALKLYKMATILKFRQSSLRVVGAAKGKKVPILLVFDLNFNVELEA